MAALAWALLGCARRVSTPDLDVGFEMRLAPRPLDANGVSMDCKLQFLGEGRVVATMTLSNGGALKVAVVADEVSYPYFQRTASPLAYDLSRSDFRQWAPSSADSEGVLWVQPGGTAELHARVRFGAELGTPHSWGGASIEEEAPLSCRTPYWNQPDDHGSWADTAIFVVSDSIPFRGVAVSRSGRLLSWQPSAF